MIKDKKFKVCLDLGNGAQSVTAKKLCEELGCEVFTINENIDGDFPDVVLNQLLKTLMNYQN